MKKYILKVVLVALVFANLSAQNGRKIAAGFRLGAGLSDIFYEKLDAKPRQFGGQASFFIDFPIEDVYSISSGIGYVQKGERQIFVVDRSFLTFAPQPDTRIRSINYVQIPLYFSYRERDFRLDAGIYGGYAVAGTEKWLVGKSV